MPRFYLHQRSPTQSIEDLEGHQFKNLDAAMTEAVAAARELMADRVRGGIEPDGWRFEITDAQGVLLAVVPYHDTLSLDGSLDDRKQRWIRTV